MHLRPGNSGANTVTGHVRVLTGALAQIPSSSTAKILIRVDGAGSTHGLLEHLEALNTTRRTVRYTVGWKITDDDERAIARLPEAAWETSVHQDGSIQEGYFVAELTGVNTREGRPEGMRLIVRRVRPSRRHLKKLTAFEKQTGWRNCVTATNIRHIWGIAGSGHAQFLDVLHRTHASVEDRVRTNKAMGLGNLPSASWEHRRRSRRMAAAAVPARHRRPGRRRAGHHAFPPLPSVRPTRRRRPPPLPADQADLALGEGVHHLLAPADRPTRRRLTPRPPAQRDKERSRPARPPGGVEPRRSRSDTRRPRPRSRGTNRANRRPGHALTAAEKSRLTPCSRLVNALTATMSRVPGELEARL
ncbi:hypothetical protein [Streptomyces sp. NPDC059909]|uniref:hypothetical protein n=1 Tax=Streptomyces sp. NPDC059909 TaxID=3346998 RepID=UPI0036492720